LPFFVLVILAFGLLEWSIYQKIREQAAKDEARPGAALVVFGAAQYNGTPSPVLKARLDHAFDLEEAGLAPVVITTGGHGKDPHYTEADVGRDYLVQKGVAENKVLVENRGETTYQSVQAVARMLGQRNARTCIAISDGFHLYRVKLMFKELGITCYSSPAPDSPIEAAAFNRTFHSLREAALVSLWYVGFKG
jgi:uncharacterized SAM-binding protein YcdF (DUF218 family)